MCTMVKAQSCTHLESLMRECGSMEDQQVGHLYYKEFSKGSIIRMNVDILTTMYIYIIYIG